MREIELNMLRFHHDFSGQVNNVTSVGGIEEDDDGIETSDKLPSKDLVIPTGVTEDPTTIASAQESPTNEPVF